MTNPSDSHPPARRPRIRVTEPCAPYSAHGPVNPWAIAYRLDEATLRDMAVMLAIVHPGHFETILRRSQS